MMRILHKVYRFARGVFFRWRSPSQKHSAAADRCSSADPRRAGQADERGWWTGCGSFNRLMNCGICLAGFGALATSVSWSWFEVPVAPPCGATTPGEMLALTPECTPVFQGVMAMGAVCMAASWLWSFRWTLLSTMIAGLLCVVPLAFPYFVMLCSPEASAEAVWLQSQHDGLLWFGGDIFNNAEFAHRGWKSKVYLIDMPKQLAIVPLPSWSPWDMGLQHCQDLLLWLGYSDAFCNFAGKGWAMAVVGSLLLLLSSLQRQGRFVYHRAGVAVSIFSAVLLVSAVVGWSLPFRASVHINRSAELCSQRQFEGSLNELDRAVALLPVLTQDTYYVAQRGVLEGELGRKTEYTRLQDAIGLESDAHYDQAYRILEQLVDSDDSAIRREALRGVMRFAIQDYNCARFELSDERFRLALRHQPCNFRMIYLLQLQGIREGRPEVVYAMRDWMYAATEKIAFETKRVLRAAVNQHAALAAGMQGDPRTIVAAQHRARQP